jgi:hypothetical protein
VGRRLRLTHGYARSFSRLSATWTEPARRGLRATVNALSVEALPGPLDYEVAIPPTRRAWVRRVPNCNLWVFYTFDDVDVRVVALTATPPVPLVGE